MPELNDLPVTEASLHPVGSSTPAARLSLTSAWEGALPEGEVAATENNEGGRGGIVESVVTARGSP